MKKRVFYVEDDTLQRLALKRALTERGFDVVAVGTVAEARQEMTRFVGGIDVALYDLLLEMDPHCGNTSGAILAAEMWKAHEEWPPEFLFHSALENVEYYRLALQVRVGAYLGKSEATLHDVIRYIRVLALRHALSVRRPGALKRLGTLAQRCPSGAAVLQAFCHDILEPELRECLGAGFALVLESKGERRWCGGSWKDPWASMEPLRTLQAIARSRAMLGAPFIIDESTEQVVEESDKEAVRALRGATVVRLAAHQFAEMFLLLEAGNDDDPLAESAPKLAHLLGELLGPTIVEHMLTLVSFFERFAERERTAIQNTSRLTLVLGHRLAEIHGLAMDQDEADAGAAHLQQLAELQEELQDAGQVLSNLVAQLDHHKASDYSALPAPAVRARAVLEKAWHAVPRPSHMTDALCVEDDVEVVGSDEDLGRVFQALLQWMVQRAAFLGEGAKGKITARCTAGAERAEIIIDGPGRRLPRPIREELFMPLTDAVLEPPTEKHPEGRRLVLALYVARMLLAVRHHGTLEDRSDALAAPQGHRFVVTLPRPLATGAE
jgi:CheY-like chemotaxis protein